MLIYLTPFSGPCPRKDDMSEPTQEPIVENPNPTPSPEMVSKEDMDRALTDLKKYKAQAKELADQIKAKEVAALKEKQDWQKIAEIKEQEAKSALEEKESLKNAITADKKLNAVLSATAAMGLRKEAIEDLTLLDMSDVQIEYTNTGKVSVIGADKFAERLKTLRPHWFGQKSNKINSNSPDVGLGDMVTLKQIKDAEKKARESGDYAPYQNMLKMFTKQKQLTK